MTSAQLFATAHARTHSAADLVSKMFVLPSGESRDRILTRDLDALVVHLGIAWAAARDLQRHANVEPEKGD